MAWNKATENAVFASSAGVKLTSVTVSPIAFDANRESEEMAFGLGAATSISIATGMALYLF